MKQLAFSLKLTAYALLLHVAIISKADIAYADTATDCSTDLDQENERYILSGNVTGDCVITANGVIIDGQGLYSITGDVIATSVDPNGGPGYDITLEDLVLNGEISTFGDYGEDGGDVTIINSTVDLGYYGVINSRGGEGSYISGGNGGNVSITDSEISGYYGQIDMGGGVGEYESGWGNGNNGGHAGNITVSNSDLAGITIDLEGGSGDNGGNGGNVTVTDSTTGDIDADGGEGYDGDGLGGNGGAANITDSEIGGLYADGGDGADTGGNGNTIIITDSIVHEDVTANGGGNGQYGGSGGNITISHSVISDKVEAGGSYAMNGGDGGSITFEYSSAYSIATDGGNGYLSVGNGGDITFKESIIDDGEYGYGGISAHGDEDGVLTLINVGPSLTVDPDEETVNQNDDYDEMNGVSAEDFVDGDLLEEIEISGAVNTAIAGQSIVEYLVYDNGLTVDFNGEEATAEPEFASASRIVTVVGEEQENTSRSSVSGGRAGGLGNTNTISSNSDFIKRVIDEIVKRVEEIIKNGETVSPAILSFISNLGNTSVPSSVRDLEVGSSGEDVRSLQNLLMTQGHSISSGVTGYFGLETQAALIAYQQANNISPAVGYFGVITRATMKAAGLVGLWW